MYQALYRTERPETFDEVIGQDHIVKILKNQVKKNQVGHAYLFCGTRGTGKTSMARILAKGVNCTGEGEKPCGVCPNCRAIQNGNFIDVIEIDGASNNGVENVRELRESVNYPPAVGKKKVYIIDEAHELTSHALNALLKTLEEPPKDVIFILATTDPQKLLQTILSRCLRLDFHRIPEGELKSHMKKIAEKRGVAISDDALNLIAVNADGSARDALSLLDQCLAGADSSLDRDAVLEYLGAASDEFYLKLTDNIISGDASGSLVILDQILREGKDVKQILSGWLNHYRSLLIGKFISNPEDMLNMSSENVNRLKIQAGTIDLDEINKGIMTLAEAVNDARYSPQPRILMELAIMTMIGDRIGAGIKTELKETHEEVKTPELKIESETNPESNHTNLVDIWDQVWDEIDDPGSVTIVRINSSLAGLTDTEFKVLVSGETAANMAEKNRDKLEDALEKITGRKLKMVIKEAESQEEPEQEDLMNQLKDQLESKWDIPITIEE